MATFLFANLFWFAALSILPKGIGGVFVDYGGYIKIIVNLHRKCCFVLLSDKNQITIFYSFLIEKIDSGKKFQLLTKYSFYRYNLDTLLLNFKSTL